MKEALQNYREPGIARDEPLPPLEWRPQRRTAIGVVVMTAIAVAIHLWDASLKDEAARLHPDLVEAASLTPLLLLASTLYLSVALAREAAWTVKRRSRRARWAFLGGSVALHLTIVLVASAAVVATDRDFLFGEHVVTRSIAPDGEHEAYLYSCTLLGTPKMYDRERGSLVLREVTTTPIECDGARSAHLEWNEAGEPVAYGPDGEPLPPAKPFDFHIWSGC